MGLLVWVLVVFGLFTVWCPKPLLLWYVARRLGLEHKGRALVKGGMRLGLRDEVTRSTDEDGRETTRTTTYIDYRVELEHAPGGLRLQPESSETGALAARGQRELVTEDVDFDDLLWVQGDEAGPALAYLTQSRRQELVRAFWRLPDARVQGRRFAGSQRYSSYSVWRIARICLRLSQEIDVPKDTRRLKGAGWVNRHQRFTVAAWLFVLASLTVGGGVGVDTLLPNLENRYTWGAAVAACPMLLVGMAYILSLPGTTGAMRVLIRTMQAGCLVAAVGVSVYTQSWWALLALVAALAFTASLQSWYHHVGRVRTGGSL